MKKKLRIAFAGTIISIFFTSCGIPQFDPPPATPSIQKIGSTMYINLEPTRNEYTQGIVVLYKLYQDSSYSSAYDSLSSYTSGSQAYSAFVQAGFAVAVNGSSGDPEVPSLFLSDYPSLFSDTELESGFSSDTVDGIIIDLIGIGPMTLNINEGGSTADSWDLQRNGTVISTDDFTQAILDYPAADSDVPDGSFTYLDLVIAVFGYRSAFGEGVQYSLPAVLTPSEVYTIN